MTNLDHMINKHSMISYDSHLTARILDLTLEIIYLLTGEVYGPIKKESSEHGTTTNHSCVSTGWSTGQSSIVELLSSNNKKVLEVTNNILELLTGEVPVRFHDVTVYFSMEEWQYLEGHKDFYGKVMMENEPALTSPDGFNDLKPPERCTGPLCSQDCTEEHQNLSQDGSMGNIKVEVKEEEAKETCMEDHKPSKEEEATETCVDGHKPCKEEEATETCVEGHKPCKEEEATETCVEGHKPCTEEEAKETFVEGHKSCKEEEIPSQISTAYKANGNITPEGSTEPLQCSVEDIVNTTAGETIMNPNLHLQRSLSSLDPSLHTVRLPDPTDIVTSTLPQRGGSHLSHFHSEDSVPHELSLKVSQTFGQDPKSLACSECGQVFLNQVMFLAHHKTHICGKPYKCSYCGKGFAHKSDFSKHQRVHTGEKPFSCLECGKSFTQKSNHMRHQRIHLTEKPYSCSKCAKSFTQKPNYERHVQSHCEEKSYSCRLCGKHFSLKAHLLQHQSTHGGQKPFCCTQCGKCFAHQSSFVRHQKNHTGDKPYFCPHCGDRFTQSSSLARHQQRHLQLLH
ncbi:oocyte zinc finger protein XlCOF7.1-like [Hyperolius riggenbachi]|uniref:oocyte zinc finger protein XlCOF7.1-like n=1 Tax=Hyperolius riggenbachi TaxID=752182 RepID=UPI0035A3086F